MITLSHIVHPVIVAPSSDLTFAQPITFETMKIAREFVKNTAEVTLYAVQYHDEDRVPLPGCFIRTPDLHRSIIDVRTFRKKRRNNLVRRYNRLFY